MPMSFNGTTGLTFPDGSVQNTVGYSPWRNRIINGDMRIWQRSTTGSSGYTSVDRWLGINTTSFNRSTDVPTGFQYSLEFGSASATYIITDQRIEATNCVDLVGQKITISFYAKNVSGSSWIGVELYYANSVDNFSGITMIDSKTWLSPSSNWTQYTFTTTAVLPSNTANGLVLRIYRNTDTASTTRITGVQLEAGTTATPFERVEYGEQLRRCQRYYFKTFAQGTAPAQNVNANNQILVSISPASTFIAGSMFPVAMRTFPTVVTYNPYAANSSFRIPSSSTDVPVTGYTATDWGIQSFTTSLAAPFSCHAHYTASAEL